MKIRVCMDARHEVTLQRYGPIPLISHHCEGTGNYFDRCPMESYIKGRTANFLAGWPMGLWRAIYRFIPGMHVRRSALRLSHLTIRVQASIPELGTSSAFSLSVLSIASRVFSLCKIQPFKINCTPWRQPAVPLYLLNSTTLGCVFRNTATEKMFRPSKFIGA